MKCAYGLLAVKTLAGFDFTFQPSIKREQYEPAETGSEEPGGAGRSRRGVTELALEQPTWG